MAQPDSGNDDSFKTIHKVTGLYDARGRRIEERFYGIDNKPIRGNDGYARLTIKWDERGNRIEDAIFDVDDKPLIHVYGYHRTVIRYDARGNLVEESYWGAQGEPAQHRAGMHRSLFKYDRRDNQIEWAMFGIKGEPVLNRNLGFHRRVPTFDHEDFIVDTQFFDAENRPMPVDVTVTVVGPRTQAAALGIKIGDVLLSYDGQPVANRGRLSVAQQKAIGKSDPVELRLRRGEEMITLKVKPGPIGVDLKEQVRPVPEPRRPDAK